MEYIVKAFSDYAIRVCEMPETEFHNFTKVYSYQRTYAESYGSSRNAYAAQPLLNDICVLHTCSLHILPRPQIFLICDPYCRELLDKGMHLLEDAANPTTLVDVIGHLMSELQDTPGRGITQKTFVGMNGC